MARIDSGVRPAMQRTCSLVVLLLGAKVGACVAAELPPVCSSGLAPTFTVPPKLPPRLHNEFVGRAQVAFVIDTAGHVRSPALLSAEWHPVGRSSGQPIGYNEAILSAAAQWRYPKRQRACRHQVPIEFQLNRASTTVGGPDSPFKPTPPRNAA